MLLALTAAGLQRIATAFAAMFPYFNRGPVFANTAVAGQCAEAAPPWTEKRRARLRQALRSGFGVQYWGETFTVDHLAVASHGAFIIEIAKTGASAAENSREVFFSIEEVRRIGLDGRRPVLGYLNLAKIEPYRDYWVDALAFAKERDTLMQADSPWIGPSLGKDGTLARFWTPEWEAILANRVDRLLSQGVDGLFLDDVLQYYEYHSAVSGGRPGFAVPNGPASAIDFAQAMMKLVIGIANRSRLHDCGALIVVNNGVFIGRDAGEDPPGSRRQDTFDLYRSAIDGILIESVFASSGDARAIAALQQEFAVMGIPVLTIDFVNATEVVSSAETRAAIGQRATSEGFFPYVADDTAFNQLYPPMVLAQADQVLP